MSTSGTDQLLDIQPGDTVVIAKSQFYNEEAEKYSGITTVVTSVGRNNDGTPYSVCIEADKGQWNWVDVIEKVIRQPITPATNEELTAMLFGN